ncbi:unnamed protein product [Cladocopium goreaui]|uniref:Uncharacterized protein n=1 Tax=Cladocopium goreaui TaxID=2562237 RepID=A0A9P1DEL8_9DINO|nr:unnamed protein product [Cladocopium goreaui]
MVTKAIQWAQKTGNIRVNEVHGEQEIRLILNETFVHKELREEETTREGSIAVEDESGSLFDTALPDINSSNASLLPAADGNKPKGDGDLTTAPNASGIRKLEIQESYVTCTKLDVSMNSLLLPMKAPSVAPAKPTSDGSKPRKTRKAAKKAAAKKPPKAKVAKGSGYTTSEDEAVDGFVDNFARGASAKEVFVQAERTRKLLEKHGA